MFKLFKFLTLCLLVWPAFVFAVPESKLHIVYKLLDEKKLFSIDSFTGQNDISLAYLKFGEKKGSKGSLIFVNGLGEHLVMYLELFYDLHLEGWSPIYTYDHRGQGLSERILPDPHTGYVKDWSFYREDLRTFVELVLKDPEVDKKNLFFLANSMGSAVVVEFFQNFPEKQNLFNSVVLASPFFGLNSRGFPFAESVFPAVIQFVCLFRDCLSPIVSSNSKHLNRETVQNRITSSEKRYNLFAESSRMYSVNYIVPSLDWVIKAFRMNRRIMNRKNISQITLPVLILQAQKDSVVSNRRQKRFCRRLKNCSLKVIEGRHDHFIEVDSIRDQAVLETLQFFQQTLSP